MVIFDSSIFIDELRTGRHAQNIAQLDELMRTSSVVLAELWRGSTTRAEQVFLDALAKRYPILTPTEKNWLESGHILRRIQLDKGFGAVKLRDLHFDVLIALTARSCGARLITSNGADFELIRRYRDFKLEIW